MEITLRRIERSESQNSNRLVLTFIKGGRLALITIIISASAAGEEIWSIRISEAANVVEVPVLDWVPITDLGVTLNLVMSARTLLTELGILSSLKINISYA